MNKRMLLKVVPAALLAIFAVFVLNACAPQELQPIVYTVTVPAPETQYAEIEVVVPSGGEEIELMMPVWSPGYYRVENYASRVEDLAAHMQDGAALRVDQPEDNRWHISTDGAETVIVSYRLLCNGRSVTTNWISEDLCVLNGAAAFITLAESTPRPHEVHIEMPASWTRAMTGLDDAPDGIPNHFQADDYDILVDSPIVAGNPVVTEFETGGKKHYLVDIGDLGQWESARAAADIEKFVEETFLFWGFLPYEKYVFLNVFRRGGGGLEHKNSTLLTSSAGRSSTPSLSWLMFVSHEYFHTFNVKRLRPVELGPFDYENPPNTSGLWIAEGFTSYYGDLLVARCGLCSTEEYLSRLSSDIGRLQNTPGRLVQTLERSSLDVWTIGMMGGDNATTISYYVKGAVAGFLLDAEIQRATDGMKSLDDVMRLAYQRYGGERGFTADEFRETAEEIAGIDMKDWFRKTVSSTEELEYDKALEWFGLRFAGTDAQDSAQEWNLEIRKDATESQKDRMQKWLRSATDR
ncbi:M61 family metallopeptidase [candidate division KSB1 bacterium]